MEKETKPKPPNEGKPSLWRKRNQKKLKEKKGNKNGCNLWCAYFFCLFCYWIMHFYWFTFGFSLSYYFLWKL